MEPEKDIFDQWAEERSQKPWIIRKLRFIPLWWNNDGKYLHKNIKTGIKNIWYWLPVIWKDRHWDSHYIFDIMMHKIKAQSKYIGSSGIHTGSERDAEVMMTCVRLMKLIQDETYSSEYSDYHKSKHWFEDVPGKKGCSSWESKLLEENFDEYFKKYPLIYKRVLNGEGVFGREGREDDKQIIAMNIGHINHNRARKLLFKLMEDNIEKWWD
tara:strand:- start:11715 stop:12350 length:636 start_codon:yes stop_codon:yes gene_type:complete